MAAGLHIDIDGRVGDFTLRARFEAGLGTTALFGASGAGKTTLLRMIAGLERPSRGVIRAGDRVLFDRERGIDIPVHRRGIGYVFQEARLFPHMTVRANLLYARAARKGDAQTRLAAIVELMGIGALLERRPAGLSGGERQRVAIGRALLSRPSLLMLDEPLAGVDQARRREIIPYLDRLRAEAGIPLIFVSHELDDVARLADTMVVLRHGEVATHGVAAEIFASADFDALVGSGEAGALLDGTVTHVDEDFGIARINIGGAMIELALPRAKLGDRLTLRVRARDIAIARDPVTGISIRNQISAQVVQADRVDGAHVDVVLQAGTQRLVARITRRSLADLSLQPGDMVYALLKAVAVERPPTEE